MQRSTLACLSIKILLIITLTVNLFRYKKRLAVHQDSPCTHPVLVASKYFLFFLDINLPSASSSSHSLTYNGRAVMQDCLVAIHQKLYFLPRGVASSPAGIGQDIDRQRTGGRGAEVKAENSVLNSCPASRCLHAMYFYTWGFQIGKTDIDRNMRHFRSVDFKLGYTPPA